MDSFTHRSAVFRRGSLPTQRGNSFSAFYNTNGHRYFAFGNDVDRIPQGDPAIYCQCVGLVLNHFGLAGGIGGSGLAKDMGTYLTSHGFQPVRNPSPGAIVIFQPSFGSVDSTAGHVGVITSVNSVANGSQWSISVLGANQGGNFSGQDGCNDASVVAFKPYTKSNTSVTYWSR